MKTLDHKAALELRFDSDIGENQTIRDYFYALLANVWDEGEGFSGKRPFGNSGWEHDLYAPLVKAGYISGDAEGFVPYGPSRDKAHAVVADLIHFALHGTPKPAE